MTVTAAEFGASGTETEAANGNVASATEAEAVTGIVAPSVTVDPEVGEVIVTVGAVPTRIEIVPEVPSLKAVMIKVTDGLTSALSTRRVLKRETIPNANG